MAFRLRQDAEQWFSEIAGRTPVRSKFDLYYFCLVAGLVAGRRSEPTQSGRTAPEFVNTFIEDYRAAQRLIIGMLIVAELKRLGIDLHEKVPVRQTIRQLVDPHTPTSLSDEGMRVLNTYASGGFEYLTEQRASKPYTVEEFLRDFVGLVSLAVSQNRYWHANQIGQADAGAPAQSDRIQ